MKRQLKSGFSLVEIMIALLILAALATGGAAVMYHTGSIIQIQGNKRAALELANEVLETEKAKDYVEILTPSKESRSQRLGGFTHTILITRTRHGTNIADEYKNVLVRVAYTVEGESVALRTSRSFE